MLLTTVFHGLLLPLILTGLLYELARRMESVVSLYVFSAPICLCVSFLGFHGLPELPTAAAINNLFFVSLGIVVLGIGSDYLLTGKSLGLVSRTVLLLVLSTVVYYPRGLVSDSVYAETSMALAILLVSLVCWGRPDWWEQRVRREYPLVAAIFVLGYAAFIGIYASFRIALLGMVFGVSLFTIFVLDLYANGRIRTHFLPLSVLPMLLCFLLQAIFYTTIGWPALGAVSAGLISFYLIGTSPFNERFLFRTGLALLLIVMATGTAMVIEEHKVFQGEREERGGNYRPYQR